MFAAAWAVPVACPKEIVEKAKMAAESVKNFKIVVFIMNIVKMFFKLIFQTRYKSMSCVLNKKAISI